MANKSEGLETEWNATSLQTARDLFQNAIYYSLIFVWAPAIIFNSTALIFIIKDIRKTMFPALVLLLLLCIFDTMDMCATIFYMVLTVFVKTTDAMCAIGTFFFNFFAVAAGATNSFLAIDRVIAIGRPYFYKSTFTNRTWIKICLIAGFLSSIFCVFPMIGLGDIWTVVGDFKFCGLGYREDPVKRIFGIAFGFLEFVYLVTLVVCNMILIKDLLKMRNKIIVVMPSSTFSSSNPPSESPKTEISPIEVVFAKLMMALSLAYLVLGTPARVVNFLNQFRVRIPFALTGIIHSMNGYLRVVNPIIYILIRKVDRKKLFRALCRCFKRRD